jgi:ABC-2 type transport system permease protein
MSPTISIMRRELGAFFNTPIGYVFISFFLMLTCYFYVKDLFVQGVAEMRGYFELLPLFFLIFIPAISMRLWSEERKLGTLELLLTMPIKTWQAVLGKFLAGLTFVVIILALTFPIPVLLNVLGNPDNGQLIGGYLGALVLGMVYLSIGAFASSLTGDQIVAFVCGISISFIFFLMGHPDVVSLIKNDLGMPLLSSIVERFGVIYHFQSISRGVLDSRDVIYALSVTGLFLFLNVMVVERRR